ncbi:MAG: transcription-repair coupling factor, partial [Bryobacterales bacterium]|nr:transcription-repair coupling factor [Bryobacterales bacterium]
MTHPALRELLETAARPAAYQELVRLVAAGAPSAEPWRLNGLTLTAKALYLALLWQNVQRPMVVIVDGARQAESLTELLETYFALMARSQEAVRPQLLPALDVLPSQDLSPHSDITARRAVALDRLARGAAPVTVAPVGAALLRVEAPEFHRRLSIRLAVDDELDMQELAQHLLSVGYVRREPVESEGEFSIRGGILDVFPAEGARPVRVEFFGDTVESMRTFDVETQRSVLKISHFTLLPLTEYPRARDLLIELGYGDTPPAGWEFTIPRVRPRTSSVLEQASGTFVVIDEPEATKAAADRLWKRLDEPGREGPVPAADLYLTWEELLARTGPAPRLELAELDLEHPLAPRIACRPTVAFHGNMSVAVAEARTLVEQGNRVVFFGASVGEVERLADIFHEYAVPFQLALDSADQASPYLAQRPYAAADASILLARGAIRRGVLLQESGLAIFGSQDLFDRSEADAGDTRNVRAGQMGAFTADIGDLKEGDYVVHATHGIGQFLGIREIAQGDQKGDFMLLEYSGGARLYVPLSRMDLIQRYRGAGDNKPGLDKLGGVTWEKTKSRVKAKMRDMAEELLKLYAQRQMAQGFAYSPDSNWQREFEDAFPYTETKDQLAAVQDIKRDMERVRPMDRLLCGDVGFGKTEVAMRAAFKALGDGKQVAVLCPTTVLALQHSESFKRRFAAFPARIEHFSRFRSSKELKALTEELNDGKIDIAIGTHRLLSQDVMFKDLGLVIVDEEQRFGVKHKEKLKQFRANVDSLAMSATPIPRTLHMSMLGLRDLSVIETPPKDRLAIQTVVARYNADLIKNALEQELARGGQVYYLHNRVDSIFMRAAFLQELVPEARIGVGHGQMDETALEKVILGFMHHEFDVFVCTTIVENGIDIPLANTMIIENAERYGLSELYQLRGRVGRSNRRAYAYLLVPEDSELTEVARKRLAALREFSDLGAGFKIAALDLELRGAGNLLGGEQHGHINSVGYDMYMSLLDNTVKELRGEQVAPEIHTTFTLGLDLRIPASYISDEHQRLRAYKRIADTGTREQATRILEELTDRYGPAPEPVKLLAKFSVLKSYAETIGIESVERKQGALSFKFHPGSRVDPV